MNIFKKKNPKHLTDSLEKTRSSFFGQLGDLFRNTELDDGFWEDLEDTLISADTGMAVAENVVSNLKEIVRTKKISSSQQCLKELREELLKILKEDPESGEIKQKVTRDAKEILKISEMIEE